MKKKILSIFAIMFLVLAIGAVMAYDFPSTNEANEANGWAYFDVVSVGPGEATLNFISTRDFYSCFEVRTDGDTSQIVSNNGGVNYNTNVLDGLYPYYCVKNSNTQVTIPANEYIEVRMVFGAEDDERFDWTEVEVLPPVIVPEFGAIVAMLTALGALGVFFVIRRR